MSSTVREVKLRIRVNAAGAAQVAGLQELAERRFLRNVLEALDQALHARLGPRAIVHVRFLPLRWRLTRDELADLSLQQRLGSELAEALAAEALAVPAARAGAVQARTRGAMPRPRPDARVVVFADQAHALAVALAERSERLPAAAHHPAATPSALWQLALADDEIATAVLALLRSYEAQEAALRDAPPELMPVLARLTERVQLPLRGQPRGADQRAASSIEVEPRALPATPRIEAEITLSSPHARPASTSEAAAQTSPPTRTDRQSAPSDIRELARTTSMLESSAPTGEQEPRDTTRTTLATRLGGAFYLLSCVAELELGEHLWCAGVAEGPAVAAAIALLSPRGERTDPALAVVAGAFHGVRSEPPALPPWAADEVVDKTRDALGRWLARRAIAVQPEALAVQLATLAASLEGEPGEHACEPTFALLAAALAALVCARLEQPWSVAPARELLQRVGSIAIDDDEIRVELPLATVQLSLRRAGLDFDPGWVPWLARRVRIVLAPGGDDVC